MSINDNYHIKLNNLPSFPKEFGAKKTLKEAFLLSFDIRLHAEEYRTPFDMPGVRLHIEECHGTAGPKPSATARYDRDHPLFLEIPVLNGRLVLLLDKRRPF